MRPKNYFSWIINVGFLIAQFCFRLFNTVHFGSLVPGDKYTLSVLAYSKGAVPMTRDFSMNGFTKPPVPTLEEGSIWADSVDYSVNFRCSFYYGYTKVTFVTIVAYRIITCVELENLKGEQINSG